MSERTDWDDFDPEAYLASNYREILEPDRWLCRALVEAWDDIARSQRPVEAALDVGTGPNLYPVLAALPHARAVTACELSARNRAYLERQVDSLDPSWRVWLALLEGLGPAYAEEVLLASLRQRFFVTGTSIFDLAAHSSDVASMFFCAESITRDGEEFLTACRTVAAAVRPGGALICAFMAGSGGYTIAGRDYPALPIFEADVLRAFEADCEIRRLERVPGGSSVRHGYEGMLFLYARRTRARSEPPQRDRTMSEVRAHRSPRPR